jgi:DNA (cytosine-5)-methyltransferase 3A
MNVLSLFDGISCGQVALERAGIKVDKYYASEIEKRAISVTQHNFPKTIQIGNVLDVQGEELPKIDLLMGGSPCQGFSLSGKQLNFEDPRSKLFFEFVRLLREVKPKYFLLENVKMKKEYSNAITNCLEKELGTRVEPVFINSRDFSAQSRGRLYWTNIPFEKQYESKEVFLRDIMEPYYGSEAISDEEIRSQLSELVGKNSKYYETFKWKRDTENRILVMRPDELKIQRIGRVGFGRNKSEIITVLTQPFVFDGKKIRKVNPLEAERLQTLPDNYTDVDGAPDSSRYKMTGNGWTVDVIAHIFNGIKNNNKEKQS